MWSSEKPFDSIKYSHFRLDQGCVYEYWRNLSIQLRIFSLNGVRIQELW